VEPHYQLNISPFQSTVWNGLEILCSVTNKIDFSISSNKKSI
jgi:hypothetical protein